MSGKRSRSKGARGEREFVNLVNETVGAIAAARGAQLQAGGSIKMADVILRDNRTGYTVAVEVKRRKSVSMRDVLGGMQQAIESATSMNKHGIGSGTTGYAVAHRSDRGEWLITVPAEYFVALMAGYQWGIRLNEEEEV